MVPDPMLSSAGSLARMLPEHFAVAYVFLALSSQTIVKTVFSYEVFFL